MFEPHYYPFIQSRPFICSAVMNILFHSLGKFITAPRSLCDSCRSLGCPSSPHHVPVKDWKCYSKEMENVL